MASAADLAIKISAQDGASRVLHGVSNSLRGLGSGVGSAMSGLARPMGSVVTGLGQIGLAAQGAAAVVSGIGGLGNSVFGLGALNEIEQVRASINAFTKDGAKTEDIISQIKKEAASTPFAFNEMAKATASLMPVAKSSGVALMDLVKEAEILAASNPLEGLEGASFSLREAMTGDFTSIIERFNLSRQTINKLKEEGVPNIEIVRRAMQEMGFDSDLIAAKAQTLEGRWSTFKDTLTELSTRMGQPIFDALKDGLVGVQGFLDANMETFQKWADEVARYISIVIGGFGILGQILSGEDMHIELEEMLSAFGLEGFADAVHDIVRQVGDTFRTLVQVFSGEGWEPSDSIDPFVNAVGMIATAVRDAYQAVSQAIPKIIGLFKDLLDIFNGGDSFDAAAEMLDSVFGPDMTDLILDFTMLAGQAFREFAATVMQFAGAVVAWFQANWPLIEQVVQQVVTGIAEMWRTHGDNIITIVQSLWTIIKTTIGTALEIIGGLVRAAMQLMTGDWQGAMTTLGEVALAAWNGITTIIGAALTAIAAALDIATGGMLTSVTAWLGSLGEAFSTKLAEIVGFFTEWGGTIVATISGLADSVVGAARAIGQSIVDGIRWGIVNAATSLASAAADVVRGALEAARNAIDSNSPSKVFAREIGEPIVDGVAMGMTGRQPMLDRTMAGMLQPPALQSGVPSAGRASGGFGGGVTVVFQGPVYGLEDFESRVLQAFGQGVRRGASIGLGAAY